MSDINNVQKDLDDVIAAIPVNLQRLKSHCQHLTPPDLYHVYLWLNELNSQLSSMQERASLEVPVPWPTLEHLQGAAKTHEDSLH